MLFHRMEGPTMALIQPGFLMTTGADYLLLYGIIMPDLFKFTFIETVILVQSNSLGLSSNALCQDSN